MAQVEERGVVGTALGVNVVEGRAGGVDKHEGGARLGSGEVDLHVA